ncbi:hypothetical protein BGX38DRAFT_709105 [Terfezia claveryi]|nr:hypothetical protein BGX38DRAFT_709105 [Terfezia claveryi]
MFETTKSRELRVDVGHILDHHIGPTYYWIHHIDHHLRRPGEVEQTIVAVAVGWAETVIEAVVTWGQAKQAC